ncbi:MAG: type II toxin-antitoxin system HicB family antitoxin [Desulfamplus sp.]|nr:type II toxin-antitoxin system HicB family antitoxin [Desulfamplus sp.]
MPNYIGIVHKDTDSDYSVFFPDFPGCITAGSTIDEAKKMAHEALSGHIEIMREEGYDIPEPSSPEKIMGDPDYMDAIAFLMIIMHDSSADTVRVNIAVPENMLHQIDFFAKKHGVSRSSFIVNAAQRMMSSDADNHVRI